MMNKALPVLNSNVWSLWGKLVPDTDDVKQKKLLFTVNALGVMRYCFMFLLFCFTSSVRGT